MRLPLFAYDFTGWVYATPPGWASLSIPPLPSYVCLLAVIVWISHQVKGHCLDLTLFPVPLVFFPESPLLWVTVAPSVFLRLTSSHRHSILTLLYILRARCGRAGPRNGPGVI